MSFLLGFCHDAAIKLVKIYEEHSKKTVRFASIMSSYRSVSAKLELDCKTVWIASPLFSGWYLPVVHAYVKDLYKKLCAGIDSLISVYRGRDIDIIMSEPDDFGQYNSTELGKQYYIAGILYSYCCFFCLHKCANCNIGYLMGSRLQRATKDPTHFCAERRAFFQELIAANQCSAASAQQHNLPISYQSHLEKNGGLSYVGEHAFLFCRYIQHFYIKSMTVNVILHMHNLNPPKQIQRAILYSKKAQLLYLECVPYKYRIGLDLSDGLRKVAKENVVHSTFEYIINGLLRTYLKDTYSYLNESYGSRMGGVTRTTLAVLSEASEKRKNKKNEEKEELTVENNVVQEEGTGEVVDDRILSVQQELTEREIDDSLLSEIDKLYPEVLGLLH